MKSFFEILKSRQIKKFNKSVFKKVLTILILVLVPLAVFTLITSKTPVLGGIRSFAVLTGSMNPTFDAGSVIFTQKLSSYQKGDVIAFEKDQVTITHRITDVQEKSGEIFYQTKGDANNAADSELVSQKNVLGKEVVAVPYIGRFVMFLRTLPGFILFIILPSLIFIGLEILNIKKEMVKEIEKKFQQKLEEATKNSPKLVLLGVFILTGLLTLNNTYAYFSDSGTSSSNTFTASNCFSSGSNVVINEVFYDVDSNHDGTGGESSWEWVELYNPTSSSVVLTGWKIGSGASFDTFPGTITLNACSFAIVTPASQTDFTDSTKGNWTLPGGTTFIQIGSAIGTGLNNNGDNVILQNSSSTEIDAMSYGTDTSKLNPAATDVATGHSLERDPDGKDTGAAADFVDRTNPTPGS